MKAIQQPLRLEGKLSKDLNSSSFAIFLCIFSVLQNVNFYIVNLTVTFFLFAIG
jgi:hypothetical protein